MGYSPSPRPTFERATPIPYEAAARHLWGDKEAGEVADWIYVSSDKIHQIVFGLPPRGWFKHSDSFRTIFGADVVYYVMAGVMVIANPETGEVQRVNAGEAAFYRRDTWHHAFNYSDEPLRVLEFFAPPPSTGTSGVYAKTKPLLTDVKYTRDELLGKWPMQRNDLQCTDTIRVIGERDVEWRLEGKENLALVGLLVASEHLTVGKLHLLPGQHTDVETHGGDEAMYVLGGTVNVRVHDGQRPNWFELNAGDGCYVPKGTPHECFNTGATPATVAFGIAPQYLP